jgi:hypothetical protein
MQCTVALALALAPDSPALLYRSIVHSMSNGSTTMWFDVQYYDVQYSTVLYVRYMCSKTGRKWWKWGVVEVGRTGGGSGEEVGDSQGRQTRGCLYSTLRRSFARFARLRPQQPKV